MSKIDKVENKDQKVEKSSKKINKSSNEKFIIAVDNIYRRRDIFKSIKKIFHTNCIHTSSRFYKNFKIGVGNIIMPNVVFMLKSSIKDSNIFFSGSIVSHHCKINSYNNIYNNKVSKSSTIMYYSTTFYQYQRQL